MTISIVNARLLNVTDILPFLGGHLGRDKTYHKIAARFYWKTLWSDVKNHVQQCQTCQTTNDAKFIKASAPLHPIPVRSKVWNQVIEASCTPVHWSLTDLVNGRIYVPKN